MTGPEYDAELEAFLKRRSPMHRRLSDIDHAEPSVELDRLVLNRAREAIDTPSQPLFRSSRWALPIGLAATILVAFTVVLNIDRQGAKVASNASPAAEAASPAPVPAVARAASVREPERVDHQPRLLTDSSVSERREAQIEKKTEAPVAMAGRSQAAKSEDAANAAADSKALIASTGAAVSQAPMAPPPPVPPAAAGAADPHSSPDAWLREINRLRTAGRTADADHELAAFREAYPTHPAYSVAKPPTR